MCSNTLDCSGSASRRISCSPSTPAGRTSVSNRIFSFSSRKSSLLGNLLSPLLSSPLLSSPLLLKPHLLTYRFVIVKKSPEVPLFFEYLKDYGNNRLEWINHLRFKGFEFNLLSQSWLYHVKHKPSALATNYDQKRDVNGKILQLRESELNELYKETWRLPLCNNAQESYGVQTITVKKYLERIEMEEKKKQTESYKKDMAIAQKFAKRREQRMKKKNKTK